MSVPGVTVGDVAEVEWTRQQQANTLLMIPVLRAVAHSADPGQNVAVAARELEMLVPGELTSEAFLSVGPDMVSGLVNLAAMLVEWHAKATGVPVGEVLDNAEVAVRNIKLTD